MFLHFDKALNVHKFGFMVNDSTDMVADSSCCDHAMLLPLLQYWEKHLPASWVLVQHVMLHLAIHNAQQTPCCNRPTEYDHIARHHE